MHAARIQRTSATVRLELPQPYDVGAMLGFLRQRAVVGLEVVGECDYARTLRLPGGPAVMWLQITGDDVELRISSSAEADVALAVERTRWLLDLDTDLNVVEQCLGADPHLARSFRAHRGLRVHGHVDGFEIAIRAIVGQQISVAGARTILGRIVAAHGEPIETEDVRLTHCFPVPEVLAAVSPDQLPMPRSRGRALVGLAAAVADGRVVLDRSVPLADARRALLALPGIGPWTADYIALRALGDRDVFLTTDLGVRHGLRRMGLEDIGPDVIDRWAPWRSYALMHVWKALEEVAS